MVNTFPGQLCIHTYDGGEVIFSDYGEINWVSVKDLQNIRSKQRGIYEMGALGIIDKDVIKFLRIEKLYDGTVLPEELDKLIASKTTKKLENLLSTLDRKKLHNLANVVHAKSRMGEVDSSSVRDLFVAYTNRPQLFK